MWLEQNANAAQNAWTLEPMGAPIVAAYRRGVFRAKVNVHELTCAEARIECLENPAPGTTVWLSFSGLEARAAIVERSECFRIHLRFAEPFHPAVFDAVIAGTLRRYH